MSYCRTKETRKLQFQLIHQWKPWEQSTGPKTPQGKRKAAMRGFKGAQRPTRRKVAKALRDADKALEGAMNCIGRGLV